MQKLKFQQIMNKITSYEITINNLAITYDDQKTIRSTYEIAINKLC